MYPVPHNAVNRTHGGFIGYEVMMFFYGFVLGCINLWVAFGYFGWSSSQYSRNRRSGSSRDSTLLTMFNIFIAFPVFAFLMFMPFFGGWVVTPIVQKVRLPFLSSICD